MAPQEAPARGNDTLKNLMDILEPIAGKLGAKDVSWDAIMKDPDTAKTLDGVMAIFGDTSAIDDLLEASAQPNKEHEKLWEIHKTRPLTDDEFRKAGALAAAAYCLSAQGLAKACTPEAVFKYTIKVVYPYVKLVITLGLLAFA